MNYIRKQIIITAIAVFIGSASFAQNMTFTSQTALDGFTGTTIAGNLRITGTTITNITSLNGLTSISGSLIIRANPNLTSLEGLGGVKSVSDLIITDNDKLTNLSGLDNLTSVTIGVTINGNEILTSLESLEKLTTIGGLGLNIHSNPILSTLNGLNNLIVLSGRLLIGTSGNPNPLLTNFCAISQLVLGDNPQITSEYFIVNNAYNPTYAQLGNMVTCAGITQNGDLMITTQEEIDMVAVNIIAITGNVKIKEAMAGTITSLNGLANIASITGNLEILNNTALTSLEGLGNLATLGGELRIGTITGEDASSNPNAALLDFCAISGLVSGDTPQIIKAEDNTNEYFVANNGYNPNYVQLGNMGTCEGITQSSNLILATQDEIDMVAGNIIAITGNVEIKETTDGNITSLNGLANIASITGNLEILDNSMLETLKGLGNLATLGGELRIGTITGEDDSSNPNEALINFCAISGLVTGTSPIDEDKYFVENNAYNPNYAQLGNITCVKPTLVANITLTTQVAIDNLAPHSKIDGNVTIKEADAGTITSLSGLTNITSITGNLAILSNTALRSLEGLGNLTALGGELQIGTIDGTAGSSMPNAALVNFCAISDLVTGASAIETDDYFVENNGYNPTYIQLGVTADCVNTIIAGSKTLNTQDAIDNLAFSFTGIEDDLIINDTTDGNITSLTGLTNIVSVGGNLQILNNTALTSLEGLGNLAALGGKLQIGTITGEDDSSMPNAALIDFCAISQLVSGTPPQVIIGEYFVENNAYNPSYVGLASADAATTTSEMDGCRKFDTAVVSTNTFSKEEDGYRLFPNPVKDILFVKSESKITSITISNVSGQEVLKSNSGSIHVRNLSKGIYFARIVSGEKTVVEKFVKL